jgi:hypothetical protein
VKTFTFSEVPHSFPESFTAVGVFLADAASCFCEAFFDLGVEGWVFLGFGGSMGGHLLIEC